MALTVFLFFWVRKRKQQRRLYDAGGRAEVYAKAELHSDGIVQIEPQEMALNLSKPSELEVYEVPVEVNGDSVLGANCRCNRCMETAP